MLPKQEGRYLEDHLLIHSGKLHTCNVCNKNFANSRSLLGHSRIHTGSSINEFPLTQSVHQLKNINSAGEKRYKCEICQRAFTESSTRSKHMATHSTEHPFKCELCDKQFSRKSNLQRHSEIHARVEKRNNLAIEEIGQECPICFKNVTGDFKRHVKYHETVKADQGIKKYSCDVCNASYNLFNNLQAHMWRHTGKKEYSCDICKCEFSHISNVKRHMKIHSGDKK